MGKTLRKTLRLFHELVAAKQESGTLTQFLNTYPDDDTSVRLLFETVQRHACNFSLADRFAVATRLTSDQAMCVLDRVYREGFCGRKSLNKKLAPLSANQRERALDQLAMKQSPDGQRELLHFLSEYQKTYSKREVEVALLSLLEYGNDEVVKAASPWLLSRIIFKYKLSKVVDRIGTALFIRLAHDKRTSSAAAQVFLEDDFDFYPNHQLQILQGFARNSSMPKNRIEEMVKYAKELIA